MQDIGTIVLHKILTNKSLSGWARIKYAFIDSSYSTVYQAIDSFYKVYGYIPNFDELKAHTFRTQSLYSAIAALELQEIPEDIDLDVAIDVLIDTYTQNEALSMLDNFLDKVTLMDTQEIKDNLAGIVLTLDEKTHTSESVVSMSDIVIFSDPTDLERNRFPTGISNIWDSTLGGLYRQELVLIGGKRGAGKSIISANFATSQYEMNNSAVYFTIEMTAQETFQRMMAVLADVPFTSIKQDCLSPEETLKLIKTRANMFENAGDLISSYLDHRDRMKFEHELVKTKKLKDNQIIIIDDRELSITSIDLHLQKLKSKLGDKLTVAVVDYLNQVITGSNNTSMYEWVTQVYISKKLKELARKYDIAIISPYQIDDSGQARFAKGILDAADIAMLLDPHSKEDCALTLETTKIRGGPPISLTSGINWDSLRISAKEVEKPTSKKATKIAKDGKSDNYEDARELPF